MIGFTVSDAVALAIIALVGTTIGPVVLAFIARADRRAQWARDDALAAGIERVHGLVNSQMTAAKEAELAATLLNLALLRREPVADEAAIAVAQSQIEVLRSTLKARAEQAVIAEAQGAAMRAASLKSKPR